MNTASRETDMATKPQDKKPETNPNQTEPALQIKPAEPVGATVALAEEKPKSDPTKSARAHDAVDYPVFACIGCNSTNTVRIDVHLKREFHKRACRDCGKQFKEPLR